ncbi:MAG TPA: DUF3892 domain-containing protein [Dinghuibacter sp.]|uniref:DUF3892 domain-containing protein n=1 Tax=Dinghuibacter sp. TaxID=2024697 RepID=UPI002CFAE7F0|nr:DUF3892 domain-containing protein [Dinghuibacter sp.]HTJ14524.1 DUF3892 domain-containing protein [Dinghuibacter sp.]
MSRYQITCINKRGDHLDAHERISHIGGINSDRSHWKLTEMEAIKSIEDGKHFYVDVKGRSVNVVVAQRNGRKYLKTEADAYRPDNLLSLPECTV